MSIKTIETVPTAEVLIDTCLSKTNRRTPTEIHRHYQIGRIREFYIRKVKYACEMYTGKLDGIVNAFPKVDEVHPFVSDLINVLYDRDHYKMGLGHVKTVSASIAKTEKEYTKLIKYGDSMYRCKQLKRAALGKMSTMAKKLAKTLVYLEEVRQSLMRMPEIDPTTRTLLICGYPNVGKSSFMNTVSRAKVDIQPYAFTTRNLYVGHFEYKYLRWQIIDTPGILDHAIEEMNTIEMQSVTALAHLRAAILYFIDVSEECGYSITTQLGLYKSLAPLFEGKPVVFVLSKSDVKRCAELDESVQREIQEVVQGHAVVEVSSLAETNIDEARNIACELLLTQRVEIKMQQKKIEELRKMLEIKRPKEDPEYKRQQQPAEYSKREATQKQLKAQAEERGEQYIADMNKEYFVRDEWKYDAIPEILDGKNIAEYVDIDIEAKLQKLEEEECYYMQEVYGKEYDRLDTEEVEKKQKIVNTKLIARQKKELRRKQSVPDRLRTTAVCKKLESTRKKETEKENDSENNMDIVAEKGTSEVKETRIAEITDKQKSYLAFKNRHLKEKVYKGRKGESDRVQLTAKPKHLYSGKRTNGKAQRR